MDIILKTILGLMTGFFGFYYIADVIKNKNQFSGKPWSALLGTGFFTNFFDTLGIGSFAPQTAIFKFFKLVDDRLIPGTMNVGNTIPTVVQAFIFMTVVKVDPLTLMSMSTAAPLGGIVGCWYCFKDVAHKGSTRIGFRTDGCGHNYYCRVFKTYAGWR